MGTVTAKQLHQETKSILDQVELGESITITRNGREVGRLEPLSRGKSSNWDDVMAEVWQALETIKPADRAANPVLQERQRRRR